jgi:hypothetical protein
MIFTGCSIQTKTRKPAGDLKTQTLTIYPLDERVVVEAIEVLKIDSTLDLFKSEALIGIKVKGHITKSEKLSGKDYFDGLNFVETINNNGNKQLIEVIPSLKTTNPNDKKSKLKSTGVKYNYLGDKTEFELYVEKNIIAPNLGKHEIDIVCGRQKETIVLWRRK